MTKAWLLRKRRSRRPSQRKKREQKRQKNRQKVRKSRSLKIDHRIQKAQATGALGGNRCLPSIERGKEKGKKSRENRPQPQEPSRHPLPYAKGKEAVSFVRGRKEKGAIRVNKRKGMTRVFKRAPRGHVKSSQFLTSKGARRLPQKKGEAKVNNVQRKKKTKPISKKKKSSFSLGKKRKEGSRAFVREGRYDGTSSALRGHLDKRRNRLELPGKKKKHVVSVSRKKKERRPATADKGSVSRKKWPAIRLRAKKGKKPESGPEIARREKGKETEGGRLRPLTRLVQRKPQYLKREGKKGTAGTGASQGDKKKKTSGGDLHCEIKVKNLKFP